MSAERADEIRAELATDIPVVYRSTLLLELRRIEEPYGGVAALFDADRARKMPDYAPREDWSIFGRLDVRYSPKPTMMNTCASTS